MDKDLKRSPFFYVGDKYKLMKQLKELFPGDIGSYYEPFCGGGSSFLNTEAEKYIVNDIDINVISLHKLFFKNRKKRDEFIDNLFGIIKKYGLSCSYLGMNVPSDYKKEFVKTYYARYNKDSYLKMREDYNRDKDLNLLYLLLIYGFNHMIRFNSGGLFNLPVGNVDYNKNVSLAVNNYFDFLNKKDIEFSCCDYKKFLDKQDFKDNDFIFFDPPYLISQSEYNKLWNEENEKELYNYLDSLDKRGIKFGITNLLNHKGKRNQILESWMSKYKCYNIDSNYISFNDNTIKKDSKEVYVTNVCRKEKTVII